MSVSDPRFAVSPARSDGAATRPPLSGRGGDGGEGSLEDRTGRAADLLGRLLGELGVPKEDLDERHLAGAIAVMGGLLDGYGRSPEEVVGDARFEEARNEPVVLRDIPFVSMCREHLLPFRGRAHVTYLPGKAVVGLSRLAGLVDLVSHRLQTPSRLADELAHGVERTLGARGVAVRIEAGQLCPGVSGAVTSSAYLGEFRLPLWRGRLEAMP